MGYFLLERKDLQSSPLSLPWAHSMHSDKYSAPSKGMFLSYTVVQFGKEMKLSKGDYRCTVEGLKFNCQRLFSSPILTQQFKTYLFPFQLYQMTGGAAVLYPHPQVKVGGEGGTEADHTQTCYPTWGERRAPSTVCHR